MRGHKHVNAAMEYLPADIPAVHLLGDDVRAIAEREVTLLHVEHVGQRVSEGQADETNEKNAAHAHCATLSIKQSDHTDTRTITSRNTSKY